MLGATVSGIMLAALAASAAGEVFDPEYYANPWTGTCATGMMQTPIDLTGTPSTLDPVPAALVTDVKMPVINNPKISNKGSAIQITWDPTQFSMDDDHFPVLQAGGTKVSDVVLDSSVNASLSLKMWPLQVHWHVVSEHSVDGFFAAAEAHIVTAVGPGQATEWGCDAVWEGGDPVLDKCIAVFGMMFRVSETQASPSYFDTLIAQTNFTANGEGEWPAPTIDMNIMLPNDTSYYSYIGSLTTPPCAEGLRWHVFKEHQYISIETMVGLESLIANTTDGTARQLYRHNNRPIEPLNGRTVYYYDSSSGSAPTPPADSGTTTDTTDSTPRAAPVTDDSTSSAFFKGFLGVLASCLIAALTLM